MKKLLISAITALAFLFGFASCDGGMHDLKPENSRMGIAGLGQANECAYLELVDPDDESEQFLKFTWSSDFKIKMINGEEYPINGGWGKDEGVLSFKLEAPTDIKANGDAGWSKDYGGKTDEGSLYLPIGEDEYTTLLTRTDAGVTGAGPANIVLSGLIEGADYTIRVKWNSASESASISVEGESSDPTQFRVTFKTQDGGQSKNFPSEYLTEKEASKPENEQKPTKPIYALKGAGNQYTFNFVALYTEDVLYTIENDLVGVVAKDKSLKVVKDGEYTITYNHKTDGTGDVSSKNIYSMQKSALISNLEHDYDSYAENGSEMIYPFYIQATRSDFEISVQRIVGDDSMAWGSTTKDKSIPLGTVGGTLDYVDNRGLENLDGKPLKGFKAQTLYPVKLTGLTKDKWYAIKLQGYDEATVKLEQFEECGEFKDDLATFALAGAILDPNWSDTACLLSKDTDGYSVEFTATADSGEFAVVSAGWGTQYRNNTVTLSPDGDFKTVVIGGANSKMSGLTIDAKYKLTVVGLFDGGVQMKLEEVK